MELGWIKSMELRYEDNIHLTAWRPHPFRDHEQITFHHPAVVEAVKSGLTMIRVDLTRGGDPLHERLLNQYRVKGVPTIVFLDSTGRERTDLRLVDFLPPEPFLGRVAQLQQKDNP